LKKLILENFCHSNQIKKRRISMKKKLLSILMIVMIVASMLSGCGKEKDSKDASQPIASKGGTDSESTAEEGGPKKFDDVKLKMLVCWNGGFKTASDQYNNEVAKAIREKTGVTVEFEGIMMSETEKLNLMFASGDMPDMINAPYWGGSSGETAVIKKAGIEGRLLPIEDLLPNYPNLANAYDIGVVSQSYLENDLDYKEFGGHRYILPQETPGDTADVTNWAYGVFVRGDVPEALGIDPASIKTADDLYDFMVKAKEYGFKDVNGNNCIVATTYHNGWDSSGYSINLSSKKFSNYRKQEDGTYNYLPLTEGWTKRNLFIWKLVNQGLLDVECFKQSDSQADEKVGNGTALFASAQYSSVINSTKLTGLYSAHPEMRYVPVGPMTYKDGKPVVQLEQNGRGGSPAIIFPTTCSNIEAAMTYLDYVNSEEGARLCQYGIEGDTYTMNSDGQPRLNSDLLARKAVGDSSVDDELREKGISYILGRTLQADKRFTWWGEINAGDADAAPPEMVEYKKARPVERVDGYPLEGLVINYENYDKVKKFAFEGTTQTDYEQRAYFAESEEEARSILEDFQKYILTQENGIFKDYLNYVTECANSRDDILD
jgi:putative aldouronate transport system substrate-binding protein